MLSGTTPCDEGVKSAVGAAFLDGFREVMLLSALLAAGSAAAAWLRIGRRD